MARKSSAGAPRKRAEPSKATGRSGRVRKKDNQTPRGKAISEGLRRYNEKKRQEALRIAQLPQSHYDRLSDEEKRKIRKFEFMQLPTEIRLQIYGHLLVPELRLEPEPRSESGPQSESAFVSAIQVAWDGEIRVPGGALHLNIMVTCKQILDEGHEFIWKHSPLILGGDESGAQFGIPVDDVDFESDYPENLFPSFLRRQYITHLRVNYMVQSTDKAAVQGIDWGYVLSGMIRLEKVDIAIGGHIGEFGYATVDEDGYISPEQPGLPSLNRSALVTGLVAGAMSYIPKDVTIKWGMWDSLQSEITGHNNKFYPANRRWNVLGFVPPPVLTALAAKFEACRRERLGTVEEIDTAE